MFKTVSRGSNMSFDQPTSHVWVIMKGGNPDAEKSRLLSQDDQYISKVISIITRQLVAHELSKVPLLLTLKIALVSVGGLFGGRLPGMAIQPYEVYQSSRLLRNSRIQC